MSSTSGTTKEAFLAAFSLGKKKRARLTERLQLARNAIELVRVAMRNTPSEDPDRVPLDANLADLEKRVKAEEERGKTDPGGAWRALRAPLLEAEQAQVTAKKLNDKRSDKNTRLNIRLELVHTDLAEARKLRREVADDAEADRLRVAIDDVEKRADAAVQKSRADAAGALTDLIGVRDAAKALRADAERAKAKAPVVEGQRSASQDLVRALASVPGLRDTLKSTQTDPQGRTPMEQVKVALETFDDNFACDLAADKGAGRTNTAMRAAAAVTVTAQTMARGLNDPRLGPLIAKSLVREYAEEMADKLAPPGDGSDPEGDEKRREEAEKAVALTQALVMDDPVTKLLTGKITGPDAVQRIRDMAAVGQVKPSEMATLLKEQFEMRMGSLSMDEVRKGELANDVDPIGGKRNFLLKDLYGEVSEGQLVGEAANATDMIDGKPGLLNVEQHGAPGFTTAAPPRAAKGRPAWAADGSGLDFKKGAKDLLAWLATKVGDWDEDPVPDPDVNAMQAPKAVPNPAKEPSPKELEQLQKDARQKGITPTPQTLGEGAANLRSPADQLARAAALVAAAKLFERAQAPAGRDQLTQAASAAVDDPFDQKFITDTLGGSLPEELDEAALARVAQLLRGRSDALRAAGLKDGEDKYVPAPGLPQDHAVRAPLSDPEADERAKKFGGPIDWANLKPEEYLKLRIDHDAVALEAKRKGALTEAQYKHLRLLVRADEEDRNANFVDPEGKDRDMQAWVLDQLQARYSCDAGRAQRLLQLAQEWMLQVPLTITFAADRWFSDASKDKPAHGPKYTSEVVYSRKRKEMYDVIGRDDNLPKPPEDPGKAEDDDSKPDSEEKKKLRIRSAELAAAAKVFQEAKQPADTAALVKEAAEKLKEDEEDRIYLEEELAENLPESLQGEDLAGVVQALQRLSAELHQQGKTSAGANVTGGDQGGWVQERGPNYMRWRTEKDEREGRLDSVPYEDQQVFGAANPSFDKLKGGATNLPGTVYGKNYYGESHFLLRDDVRKRVAFVIRGQGTVNPVQRRDLLVLAHDMLKAGGTKVQYLDSLLLMAEKKDKALLTGMDWEVHMYGGLDLRTDVQAVYLPDDMEAGLKDRITNFATRHKIRVEAIGKKPDGMQIISQAGGKFNLDG